MKGAAAVALLAVALAGCGAGAPEPITAAPKPTAAPFVAAKAEQHRPRLRGHLLARITRTTPILSRPGGRTIARAGRRTEFGTRTTLAVAARLGATRYAIRVDRSQRRAVLTRRGRTVLRFPVAVGRPGNETPLGRFAVTDKLEPTDATSPYGCCAVALSGHQTRLEPGWPGGDRLAIHGTPQPETVGLPVSLGCMRADREPLERLMRTIPVGTPVRIRA